MGSEYDQLIWLLCQFDVVIQILSPAGESRSLANLAVIDGFEDNASGKRAFRLGIDASIWYQHAQYTPGGANPQVRQLFFRLLNLMKLPILPLFVFDGRERPRIKRGSKLGKTGSHNLNKKMKEMLDIFGMEWREVSPWCSGRFARKAEHFEGQRRG